VSASTASWRALPGLKKTEHARASDGIKNNKLAKRAGIDSLIGQDMINGVTPSRFAKLKPLLDEMMRRFDFIIILPSDL